jgi:hypothetical protein
MSVDIPAAEVEWFRGVLGTDDYLREERNYKLAHELSSVGNSLSKGSLRNLPTDGRARARP